MWNNFHKDYQDYDVETNLFLVGSRYYSPELVRFIQPADVSSLNPQSINGLNLYTYFFNNPNGIIYISYGSYFAHNIGIIGIEDNIKLFFNNNILSGSMNFDPNFLSNLFAHN